MLFEPAFDIYIVILLVLTLILQIYYNETRKALRAYQSAMLALLAMGGNVRIEGVGNAGGESGGAAAMSAQSIQLAAASASGSSGGSGGHMASVSPPQVASPVLLPPVPPPLPPLRLKLLPLSYAAVSAIIGTQSVLLAKATSDLLRTSIAGNQQFTSAFTWVILVGWASTMIFWLYRMESALRKFEGPFIVPVLQVVWTLFSIVGGGIYFQEFSKMSGMGIGLFTLGVSIMMGGVYLLAPHQPSSQATQHGHVAAAHAGMAMDAASMHLSDVELGGMAQNVSPYDARSSVVSRSGGGVDGGDVHSLSPPLALGGGDAHPSAVLLAALPPKITRVTSTGRMLIHSDGDDPRDRYHSHSREDSNAYVVEVSPDYQQFRDSDQAEASKSRRDKSMDDDAARRAERDAQKAAANGTSSTRTLGVLGEAGLLGSNPSGASMHLHTPPLRPHLLQWNTPTRSGRELSRPASASGTGPPSAAESAHGSIPPSPSFGAFDLLGHGAVKRPRGMSLGFSMPMVSLDDQDE